jgi:hypothetical protein
MEPATPAQQKPLDFLRPAIAGGLFWGALTAIPLITLANCICCLWIQLGGAIGAWLLNKQRPGTLKYGDGALVGVMAGLTGMVVSTLIEIPVQMVGFTPQVAEELRKQYAETMLKYFPDAPADMLHQMDFMFASGFNMSRLLVVVIVFSIVGGLFAMIGGILAVALMKRHRGNAAV